MKKILSLFLILSFVTGFFPVNSVYTDGNNKINTIIGDINIQNDGILTIPDQMIVQKNLEESISHVKISENTKIIDYNGEQNKKFYPASQMDESNIVTSKFILINNKEISIDEIGGLYKFNPNLHPDSYLSQDITLELLLKKPSTVYPFYIYHFSKLENGWNRIDDINYIMNTDTNTIKFTTDQFGYYIIIQNRYLENNALKISELGTLEIIESDNNETNKIISFIHLEEQLNKDLQISAVKKLAHKFYLKFEPDMTYFEYFNGFDTDITKQYKSYAQAHYNMFIALEKYILTKDNYEKSKVIKNLKIISNAFSSKKDIKTKYIMLKNNYFMPNNSKIQKATTVLRNKVENKLDNLMATNSISQEEYSIGKNSYNKFILHLTIFFKYNQYEQARLDALKQAKIFIPIYNKKIIYK